MSNVVLAFRNPHDYLIKINEGFQSRNECVAHLLVEALREVKHKIRNSFEIEVATWDKPPQSGYAFCATDQQVRAVPDFLFWNWPEVGVEDYTQTVNEIRVASQKPPEFDSLFWIGASNPYREPLLKLDDPRIVATRVVWTTDGRPEFWASNEKQGTYGNKFVSLPDHCKYKYLIDIEGAGWSARLKLFFFSGRPVFMQDRPWKEFYFDKIKPFVHFIPVKRDLSNLIEMLDWAEANPHMCEGIARNALMFAQEHLTRKAAVSYLGQMLLDHSEEAIKR